jgi:hypothetical protein
MDDLSLPDSVIFTHYAVHGFSSYHRKERNGKEGSPLGVLDGFRRGETFFHGSLGLTELDFGQYYDKAGKFGKGISPGGMRNSHILGTDGFMVLF